MKDWRGKERYIVCDNFKVGPKSSKFELISVGSCTGNACKTLFIYSFDHSFIHSFIQSVSHFRHELVR